MYSSLAWDLWTSVFECLFNLSYHTDNFIFKQWKINVKLKLLIQELICSDQKHLNLNGFENPKNHEISQICSYTIWLLKFVSTFVLLGSECPKINGGLTCSLGHCNF